MNSLTQFKKISILPLLIALMLVALAQNTQALSPPPDGGYGGGNTAEGTDALFSLTSGVWNTALGFQSLYNNSTGVSNTAIGFDALMSNTGDANTANGAYALERNTTGSDNTATGVAALEDNTTGSNNTANGAHALIGNTTGNDNTATGFQALFVNTGNQNTATGAFALQSNLTASNNTADGFQALLNNQTGKENTAVGESAFKNSTVDSNTGVGFQVAFHNTTGTRNTAVGHHALSNNRTGSSNIALGLNAGGNLTTGSNNIDIGNGGVAGEANTIRIGGPQTRTFIKGISGAVVSGAAVVVNAGGQLGMAASSERFKDEIKPMDKASEGIFAFKPVTFRYKKDIDPDSIPQFGLVAEEVEKVNPNLVVRDKEGKPYSVRYEQVNAMLLNEFLKEHKAFLEEQRKVAQQEATISQLKSTVAQQQRDSRTTAAQQQTAMDAVIVRLEAQDLNIQKVSAQLEASKPSRQFVKTPGEEGSGHPQAELDHS